nr:6,7-dimethyl-8-ribityllumazine synthase [Pseudomonas sp. S11P7]
MVRHGVRENDITIIRAPGAFEIPLVAQKVAQQASSPQSSPSARSFVVAPRPHFEYVAGECR